MDYTPYNEPLPEYPPKLEAGKCYLDRVGDIQGPLTNTGNAVWPWGHKGRVWDEKGSYMRDGTTHPKDLVAEYVQPALSYEPPEQKIRRLEHNIEVMRDSYLPARLEIAARAMQGILANNQLHVYDLEKNAAYALDMADALIKKYEETEPV